MRLPSSALVRRERRGATALEYALIAGLMVLVIVWAVVGYSQSLGDLLEYVADTVNPVL